jgi:hypothetical protein
MKKLGYFACVAAALGSIAVAGCTSSDPGPDASLRVHNNSDFVITQIHVTSVGSLDWGPNLLSGDALFPDESLTIDVNCDTYDALLIDEDGVECQIHRIDLCFSTADWVIENNTCTSFIAARAAREAAAAQAASSATSAPQ